MTYILRQASGADVPATVVLVNLAFRAEEFFVTGVRTSESEVARKMEAGSFLMAHDGDGTLAGCVYLQSTPPRGYFGMLSVHPGAQGGGLGRELIDAAEAYCRERGCREMNMSVVNVREELVEWYHRLGYNDYGTEPYLEPNRELKMPVHFILMTRSLSAAQSESRRMETVS